MDFGGFCNFFDPALLSTGDETMFGKDKIVEYFLLILMLKNKIKTEEYPLIKFVQTMYPSAEEEAEEGPDSLCQIVDTLSNNLEKHYEEVLRRLYAAKQPEKKQNHHQNQFKTEKKTAL